MQLGVCYYPEHWPEERWAQDARLMRQAGLTIVRIAEFAWAKMEPQPGVYDWGWLDRAIETLAAEGLKVVLGTPTATPPAWLVRAHPDVLPVDAQGRRRAFGSRRHYCSNAPIYRTLSEQIVRAMGQRYGQHPAVIAWQIDNEFGCHDTARCYCDHCAAAFRRWLQARYGTLAALNEAWGTVFWSQAYGDWEEIDPPHLTVTEANPSHVLDYERFSSDSVVAFQQLQLDVLRPLTPGRRLTTNFMGDFPDLNYHDLARSLDLATWDSYPTGFAEMNSAYAYPEWEQRPTYAYDVGDPYITGFCHAITHGTKRAPFWVMEQQCGHVNWATYNPGVRPAAVRLWTWHAALAGAEAVVYFRWRACRFAQEQHHSGLLNHDASPAIGLQAVHALREELPHLPSERKQAKIALLYSYEDLWAFQLQPHRKGFDYRRLCFAWWRALQRLGLEADLIPYDADLTGYEMILAPGAFLVSQQQAQALEQAVRAGATLVLGVRSGVKSSSNVVTDEPLPGVLRSLAGATVTAWHSLPPGVSMALSGTCLPEGNEAAVWAEALRPEPGTLALLRYRDGALAGAAALTEHALGAGRVLYLGWYPQFAQLEALLRQWANALGLMALDLPDGVLAAQRDGEWVVLNFNETARTLVLDGRTVELPGCEITKLGTRS